MRERLLIFASDYQHLDDEGKLFYLQKEKYKANCCTLKKYDPMLHSKANPKQIYTLKRGVRAVNVNGFEYKVLCHENAAPAPPLPQPEDLDVTIRNIGERISRAEKDWEDALGAELAILDTHLFLHDKEKRTLKRIFEAQKSNINRYKNELNELSDAHRREKQEYPASGSETDLFA